MAEEQLQVIRLRRDFYRDGFKKLMVAFLTILTAFILLLATSIYLFIKKPPPVNFATDNDWRVLAPVPVAKQYLSNADLLQWVGETFSTLFDFDFINYDSKHSSYQSYFTDDGWKKYNDFLTNFLPSSTIQASKAVVVGSLGGGPVIIKQGVLPTKVYGWWVQVPVTIDFTGYNRMYSQQVVWQALVIRVPTLDNLSGVAIDNLVIVSQKQNTTRTPRR